MFVLELFPFVEAHSFPRALLLENYLFFETDSVRGQNTSAYFAPNGGYIVYTRPHSRGGLSSPFSINFSFK